MASFHFFLPSPHFTTHAAKQPESSRHVYELGGYIACIHCGLPLRSQGHVVTGHHYYRDTARSRRLNCGSGGAFTIRADFAAQHFGALLKSLSLPSNWREIVRTDMLAEAQKRGVITANAEKEKERLKLKKTRVLKQHREGYIDDEEFQGEMAAVELALRALDMPEVGGFRLNEVIDAGEHIPGMAAPWDDTSSQERQEMIMLMIKPGELYFDLENKIIAAIKPRPAFLPILRMLNRAVEYEEANGLIVTER